MKSTEQALSARTLLLILTLFSVLWLGTIGYRKLIMPDEGRYAEIPREMVASGDWLTPRLDGLKYFEKPALQYWATAAAFTLFGEHQWTARLWSALTGLLGILATWFTARRLWGGGAALGGAGVLAGSLLYGLIGHVNTLDMGVSFFLSAAVFAFVLAQHDDASPRENRNYMLAAWLAAALAMLSKGLIGLVLPGTALVAYSLWQRDFSSWRRLHLVPGLALFAVVAVPWFVAVSLANPGFAQFFFIHEHFQRFLTKEAGRYQPIWYFLPILVVGMAPWLVALFSAPWSALRREPLQRFQPLRFLLVWIVVVFCFFSVSDSKLASYILPLFPALVLLLGAAAAALPPAAMLRRFHLIIVTAAIGAIVAVASMFLLHTKAPEQALQHALIGLTLTMLLIAGATLFGARALHHGRRRTAMHVLALAAIVGWQGMLISSQSYVDMASAAPVARIIKPRLRPGTEVFTVRTYLGGLPFYLGRLVTVVDQHRDDLDPGLASRPTGYIADVATFEQRWRMSNDAIAVAPANLLVQFRVQGLPFYELGRHDQNVIIGRRMPAHPASTAH